MTLRFKKLEEILTKQRNLDHVSKANAHIAVLFCLDVKAVHVELVRDFTSDASIAAFKKDTVRRIKVATIYSDNERISFKLTIN